MAEPKHTQYFRKRHLEPNESIYASAAGYIGKMMGRGDDTQHNGALIITDRRVVFYRKGVFGEVLETMPLKSITSVEQKSLMGHRTLRLHTSHDDLEFKCFEKGPYQEVVAAIEEGRKANSPVGDAAAVRESPADTLRKLGDLRDSGILSEEEFESKKRKLLDEM
jgi:hypothetical protein